MDWIEKIFGISPDGGNGATESVIALLSLIAAIATCVAVVAWRRRRV